MRSVWDREVGGSNPLAPTKNLTLINNLEKLTLASLIFHVANLWPEMSARDVYRAVAHGTRWEMSGISGAEPTLETRNICVATGHSVDDRVVGGFNRLAATI